MNMPTINSVIEHRWTTEAGPRACILLTYADNNQIGWRCGYVETRLTLDDEPKLADVSCHGGITYFNKVGGFAELAVGFDFPQCPGLGHDPELYCATTCS